MASRQAHRVALDTGEWLSLGVPTDRSRGWRVLSGLLAIGALSFVASGYFPLYQSKKALEGEYGRLADEASTSRTQLAAGISAFTAVKQERDSLRGTVRAAEAREAQRIEQMERVQREVRSKLGAEERRGRLALKREGAMLTLGFGPSALLGNGADLLPGTKQTLCRLHESLTLMGDVRVRVRSQVEASSDPATPASWRDAATRAASAADVLVNTCGTDAASVSVLVAPAPSARVGVAAPASAPLSLELEPAP